jgi:hypothetical protein
MFTIGSKLLTKKVITAIIPVHKTLLERFGVIVVSLAQPVEHLTFNEGVDGSNPSRDTTFQPHLCGPII